MCPVLYSIYGGYSVFSFPFCISCFRYIWVGQRAVPLLAFVLVTRISRNADWPRLQMTLALIASQALSPFVLLLGDVSSNVGCVIGPVSTSLPTHSSKLTVKSMIALFRITMNPQLLKSKVCITLKLCPNGQCNGGPLIKFLLLYFTKEQCHKYFNQIFQCFKLRCYLTDLEQTKKAYLKLIRHLIKHLIRLGIESLSLPSRVAGVTLIRNVTFACKNSIKSD